MILPDSRLPGPSWHSPASGGLYEAALISGRNGIEEQIHIYSVNTGVNVCCFGTSTLLHKSNVHKLADNYAQCIL